MQDPTTELDQLVQEMKTDKLRLEAELKESMERVAQSEKSRLLAEEEVARLQASMQTMGNERQALVQKLQELMATVDRLGVLKFELSNALASTIYQTPPIL